MRYSITWLGCHFSLQGLCLKYACEKLSEGKIIFFVFKELKSVQCLTKLNYYVTYLGKWGILYSPAAAASHNLPLVCFLGQTISMLIFAKSIKLNSLILPAGSFNSIIRLLLSRLAVWVFILNINWITNMLYFKFLI